MAKRKLYIFTGTISLAVGGLIYIIFRENTYVAKILNCKLVENIRIGVIGINSDFVSFYLPDFLWALSLCCYLLALFNPKRIGAVFCGAASFFCGALWEFGQLCGVFKGTGDIVDIIMYLSAAILAVFLSEKEKRK